MVTAAILVISNSSAIAQDPLAKLKRAKWEKKEYSTVSKDFRVGKVGQPGASALETRAKLMALHEAMTISKASVRGIAMDLTVNQGIRNGAGIIYFCDWEGKRIAVISSNLSIVDGGKLSGTFEPDGIYSGQTVMGAPSRMPQYKECVDEVVAAPNQVELVKRLKEGETFEVKILESGGCETCFGRGTLTALKGGGACSDCGGTGKAMVTYTLKW